MSAWKRMLYIITIRGDINAIITNSDLSRRSRPRGVSAIFGDSMEDGFL